MSRCLTTAVLGLGVSLAVPTPMHADAPAASWAGQMVMGRVPAKAITFRGGDAGPRKYFEFRGHYPIRVRGDSGWWLRLFDGQREGWARKDQFVLVADAPAYFTRRLRADPSDVFAWWARGTAWKDRGEHDNAIKDYTECLRLDPTNVDVLIARGNAWRHKKEFDRAIRDYGEAVRLDPTNHVVFYSRGNAWQSRKEYDRAIEDFTQCVRLDPTYLYALNNRGTAWAAKGQFDRAIRDYDAALRLDAEYDLALNNRAWVRATCPRADCRDGTKAVADARRACELTGWKDPSYLGTLAAAYAEAGRFDEAIRWQRTALADPGYEKEFGEEGRKGLALYQRGKPLRSDAPSE